MLTQSGKNKKYIFLNPNGTLNIGHWHSMEDINKWNDKYGFIYYKPAVKNLAAIINATGAEIYLLEGTSVQKWKYRKLPGKALGSIYFREQIKVILDDLINYHNEVITGFAIIDSIDNEIIPEHRSHLVMVNPEIGISQSDVEKAIRILNMGMDDNNIIPIDCPKPFSIRTSVYLEDLFDKLIHGSIKDNHSNGFLNIHMYGPKFGEKVYYREFKDDYSNELTKVTITDKGQSIITDSTKLHNNDVDITLTFQDEKLIVQSVGLDSFGFKNYYSFNLNKIDTYHGNNYDQIFYSANIVYNKEHGVDHELVPFIIDVYIIDDLIEELVFLYYNKGVFYHLLIKMNTGLFNRSINSGPPDTVQDEIIDEDLPF